MEKQIMQYKSNMKFIRNITLSAVIALFSLLLSAQDCFYYHEYFCKFPNDTYFYSGQSRSALFSAGMSSQFKMITFGGEDYNISICYERKFKNVRMRLLEDNEQNTVLYDNAEHHYQQTMSFSNNTARRLIIEISVPEDPASKTQELHCVGVLIHFRKTNDEPKNKIGF
jgi:hypothetical protein